MKHRWMLDLQMFAEGDEAGGTDVNAEVIDTSDPGIVEGEGQAAPEGQDVSQSKAFAKRLKESVDKRLAEERANWEKETSERYKDHDHYKSVADFLKKENGIDDIMTLKEKIELRELSARADANGRDVEEQARIEALEKRASKADEYEKQQETENLTRKQQEEAKAWEKTYFDGIADFAKNPDFEGVDVDKLHEFIVENEMNINPNNIQKSFALAHKAMQADILKEQLATAEKNGMRKVLGAKGSIPNMNASRGQGSTIKEPPKTMADARKAAMERDFSGRTV